MKQSIVALCVFFALFVATTTHAQVTVNPKIGVNISGIDTELEDIRAEARVGWNAGVDFRIGEGWLFFNPGLHYFSYSADLKKDVSLPEVIKLEDETSIRNLKLPLNAGIRLTGDGGLLKIYAKGGVTPTLLLGVEERPDFSFTEDDLNDITWGANVGVGLDVWFLTVDANYEIGLTDYFEEAEGKNNMFTLSVGVKF